MKIAFILPSLDEKGPIIVARHLIFELIKNHEVDVYYFDDIVKFDFPCHTFKINFFEKIQFEKYDIIHSHMLRPDLFVAWNSLNNRITAKKITTVHQETQKALSIQYNFVTAFLTSLIWNIVFLFFDKIIALNQVIKDQIWFVKKRNIFIIGNGIPKELPSDNVPIEDDILIQNFCKSHETVLGTSSLLIKRKGLDQIIKSLVYLPNVGYIIIGNGEELDFLKNLAKQLDVLDRCLFLGNKSNGYRYFKYFNIYMLTSYSEGYPISAIEAGRIGLPIICSKIKVLQSVFSDEEVIFFELENIDSLIKAIKKGLAHSNKYAEAIAHKFRNSMNSEVMCENYILTYLSI